MGNKQPPSYAEEKPVASESKLPLFPSEFKMRLEAWRTRCDGSIGTEIYNLIPRPGHGYIIKDGKLCFAVPLYVRRLSKAFRRLVSMRITPGDYVENNFSLEH